MTRQRTTKITVKRVYDSAHKDDGVRILVDRFWPRGLTRARAQVDLWIRDIAPSNELRQRFCHDPDKWDEFMRRYFAELRANESVVRTIRDKAGRGPVTLLFAAKDLQHNNAEALKEYLTKSAKRKT